MGKDSMKLKSITIRGMHKIKIETYNFDDLTYLVGPNGAGKSTVLEAIQLALLGYIPGYAKTNESIKKHSNSSIMEVDALLNDGAQEITIHRAWKGESSVKSELIIEPEGYDIASILDGIELPIFNFNEFKDMTANKLKEWFISFLPSGNDAIDWKETLESSLNSKVVLVDGNNLLDEVIESIDDSLKGVDQVKSVNATCKELQSFYKGQLVSLENTTQQLVYYDDCTTTDTTEVQELIDKLNLEKQTVQSVIAQKQKRDQLNVRIDQLKSSSVAIPAAELNESRARLHQLEADYKGYADQLQHYTEVINNWTIVKAKQSMATSTKCPFSNKECDDLAKIVEQAKQATAEADSMIREAERSKVKVKSRQNSAEAEIKKLNNSISQAILHDSELQRLEQQLSELSPSSDNNNVRAIEDIESELREAMNLYGKIVANQQYNELQEKVTSDKFIVQNKVEVLKIWTKLTDANGLQNDMMVKPFNELADKMSKYIQILFDRDYTAAFNLVGKANSFSFGLIKNDNYIQYDYLSSGERCLYTLAMMMCLMEIAQPKLKLILVDDLLDHLDDDNAARLFDSLATQHEVQMILAGVKRCDDPHICVEIM